MQAVRLSIGIPATCIPHRVGNRSPTAVRPLTWSALSQKVGFSAPVTRLFIAVVVSFRAHSPLWVVAGILIVAAPRLTLPLLSQRSQKVGLSTNRFTISVYEAVEEAVHQLSALLEVQGSPKGERAPAIEIWAAESRRQSPTFRWHSWQQRYVEVSSDRLSRDASADTEPQRTALSLRGLAPLCAPFLGCLLSEARDCTVAATETFATLAALPVALANLVSRHSEHSFSSQTHGTPLACHRVAPAIAAGLTGVHKWVFSCLDHSIATQLDLSIKSEQIRQKLQRESSQVAQQLQQRVRTLTETLRSEKEDAHNASRALQQNVEEARDRAQQALDQMKAVQNQCELQQKALSRASSERANLENALGDARSDAQTLRERVAFLEQANRELRQNAELHEQTLHRDNDDGSMSQRSRSDMHFDASQRDDRVRQAEADRSTIQQLTSELQASRRRTEELSEKLIVMAEVHELMEAKIAQVSTTNVHGT